MVEQQLTDDILAGNENHPGEGKWYIIHCYSGMEERIRKSLEQRIASMDVEDKVFDAVSYTHLTLPTNLRL